MLLISIASAVQASSDGAFEALGNRGSELEADLSALLERVNVAQDGSLVIPADYAEVTATNRPC